MGDDVLELTATTVAALQQLLAVTRTASAEHLEGVFSAAVAAERLKSVRSPEAVSLASGWNRGVGASTGAFLAFVRPGDEWKRVRLAALEGLLRRHDLILESRLVRPGGLDLSVNPASDRLLGLIQENWAVPSSGVVRRELFESAGGFPRGTVATSEEYELWVRCLVELLRSDRPGRLLVTPQEQVVARGPGFAPADGGAAGGYTKVEARLRALQARIEGLREAGSLLRSARGLPPRYWPALARRFGGGRILEAVDSARRRLLG